MMICFYSLQKIYTYENAHIRRTMTVYTSTIIYLPKTFTLRKQYLFSEMQILKHIQVLYNYFKTIIIIITLETKSFSDAKYCTK